MSAIPLATLLSEGNCYMCYAPGDISTFSELALWSRLAGNVIPEPPPTPPDPAVLTLRSVATEIFADYLAEVTTASITLDAGDLVLVAVAVSSDPVQPSDPILTGCGQTWEVVSSTPMSSTGVMIVFRALITTTVTGTLTATMSPNNVDQAIVSVVQFSNTDISGANGSGAIGAIGSNEALSANPSVTLAAINPNSLNAVIGFCCNDRSPFTGTAESGWTGDVDVGGSNTLDLGLFVSHRMATTDGSWIVTSAASNFGAIAMEIKSV